MPSTWSCWTWPELHALLGYKVHKVKAAEHADATGRLTVDMPSTCSCWTWPELHALLGHKVHKVKAAEHADATGRLTGRRCVISNFLDMQRVDEKFSSCAERKVRCSFSDRVPGAWLVIAASVRSMTCPSSSVGINREAEAVQVSSIRRCVETCAEAFQGSRPKNSYKVCGGLSGEARILWRVLNNEAHRVGVEILWVLRLTLSHGCSSWCATSVSVQGCFLLFDDLHQRFALQFENLLRAYVENPARQRSLPPKITEGRVVDNRQIADWAAFQDSWHVHVRLNLLVVTNSTDSVSFSRPVSMQNR